MIPYIEEINLSEFDDIAGLGLRKNVCFVKKLDNIVLCYVQSTSMIAK